MQENKELPMLIGIKEATKVIGVGRNTLLEMTKMKGFPLIRGERGKIYIIKDELVPFFSKHKGIYAK